MIDWILLVLVIVTMIYLQALGNRVVHIEEMLEAMNPKEEDPKEEDHQKAARSD